MCFSSRAIILRKYLKTIKFLISIILLILLGEAPSRSVCLYYNRCFARLPAGLSVFVVTCKDDIPTSTLMDLLVQIVFTLILGFVWPR